MKKLGGGRLSIHIYEKFTQNDMKKQRTRTLVTRFLIIFIKRSGYHSSVCRKKKNFNEGIKHTTHQEEIHTTGTKKDRKKGVHACLAITAASSKVFVERWRILKRMKGDGVRSFVCCSSVLLCCLVCVYYIYVCCLFHLFRVVVSFLGFVRSFGSASIHRKSLPRAHTHMQAQGRSFIP